MNRRLLIALLLIVSVRAWAEPEAPVADNAEPRSETTSDQEWEARGVIPLGGLVISSQPMTPIAVLPTRNPYDQGLEELALAQDLWKRGNAEAASDVALEAYDDLVGAHLPRKNKAKRKKLREDRHQAAIVYMDSSIAYVQDYAKKHGDSRRGIEEARARLGDLRDVAQNYPELAKRLTKAEEPYAVQPSSTPVVSTGPAR